MHFTNFTILLIRPCQSRKDPKVKSYNFFISSLLHPKLTQKTYVSFFFAFGKTLFFIIFAPHTDKNWLYMENFNEKTYTNERNNLFAFFQLVLNFPFLRKKICFMVRILDLFCHFLVRRILSAFHVVSGESLVILSCRRMGRRYKRSLKLSICLLKNVSVYCCCMTLELLSFTSVPSTLGYFFGLEIFNEF